MAHSTVERARHLATPVATVALVLVVAGCAFDFHGLVGPDGSGDQ